MRELLLRRFPLSVKRFFGFLFKNLFFRSLLLPNRIPIVFIFVIRKICISALTVCGDHPSPTGIAMMSAHYPTDKGVAARVEELLREQLLELGEDPASLAPHLMTDANTLQCARSIPTSPWCISGRTSRSSASPPSAPIRASCGACSPATRVNRSSKKKKGGTCSALFLCRTAPFLLVKDSLSR